MLRITKEEERKRFPYLPMIDRVFSKELYHTFTFSDMNNVEAWLIIRDHDSESVVSIPGGLGLVGVTKSGVSTFTEEPVTVQSNGSDSKEEHPKK